MTLISDEAAARAMACHVDDLVILAQTDPALQVACMKFQMEHASARAEFDSKKHMEITSPTGSASSRSQSPPQELPDPVPAAAGRSCAQQRERVHLLAALRRMLEFAVTTGLHALSPVSAQGPGASQAKFGDRSSSVDDLNTGEASLERRATMMHLSTQIIALAFIVAEELRTEVQSFALEETGLLRLVSGALKLSRELELEFFAEGFKTDHMNVLSNFTFGSGAVCAAVAADEQLLLAVLAATRIDEENPGMVEWAEFALRNVCKMSPDAQAVIRAQVPMSKPQMM